MLKAHSGRSPAVIGTIAVIAILVASGCGGSSPKTAKVVRTSTSTAPAYVYSAAVTSAIMGTCSQAGQPASLCTCVIHYLEARAPWKPAPSVVSAATTFCGADALATGQPTAPPPQYPPGYPIEVPVSQTPEQMSDYLQTGGATTAIAVAPGVWVFNAPGTSIDQDAASGSLIGWCASVDKFEAANPDRESGATCW